MQNNKRTKILLGILVLVALAGFPLIKNNLGLGEELLVAEVDTVGYEEVLAILNQVESIMLDTSVLRSPEFLYLSDLTAPLPNLPVGRENPFASF